MPPKMFIVAGPPGPPGNAIHQDIGSDPTHYPTRVAPTCCEYSCSSAVEGRYTEMGRWRPERSWPSGKLMQRFIAELSGVIDKLELERSWKSDTAFDPSIAVTFGFAGRRVSITIDSDLSNQWKSDSFHRTFSNAIHRVDQHCNIRWL
jgi:hypothetical protein